MTRPFLIAIAGLSGSGKTALANALARRLDRQCAVVALDSYYHHLPPEIGPDERAARNYDHPDALDWPLLESHLATLLSGSPIEAPVYRFDAHARSEHTQPVEPYPYLILEGILAIHYSAIRSLAGLRVFVETGHEVCLTRRIERDVVHRGRTRESVLDQYRATVWPMAQEHVLPSRAHADLLVSGEGSLEESCEAVLRRLESAKRHRPVAGWAGSPGPAKPKP